MQKNCSNCKQSFDITDVDLKFYDQVSPIFNGQKYVIPSPTHCPNCRQQRRLALANERFFYSSKCELCDQKVLTEQDPRQGKTVYCRECWHSDQWDPRDYGREVDFNRPIFEQFQELWNDVPTQNLLIEGINENADYIHYAGFSKNCYLIMHADFCEDCSYGYGFKKNKSCIDGFYNLQCELCYDCVDINQCYGLTGSQDCFNCSSSAFLRDCVGSKNCFLSVGLRNKEYVFENKQLTKEEYKKKMAEIDLGDHEQYQKYKQKLRELEKNHTFKEFHGQNKENCSGDYLTNCKNVHDSFDCEDVEDSRFLYQVVTGAKNNYDIYQYGLKLSESYECSIVGNNAYHILFSHNIHTNCSDIIYGWALQSCKDCFGSINMHHKQYCILNKQYSKEEYEALVPKIIEHMKATGEWGELFPIHMSPFGYNKTNAQMYYPMTKEEVLAKGWKWDDHEAPAPKVEKVIPAGQLPENIDEVPDDILNWAIVCETRGKPFKITPQELKFYRTRQLPLPRRCPDQRHLDRFALRNPRKLIHRECGQCEKEIETTYDTDQPEKIYCEECHAKEVY